MAKETAKTITATLIRGKTYFFKRQKFVKGVAEYVSAEVAQELEQLADEVVDRDGDVSRKPQFKVEYVGAKTKSLPTKDGKLKKLNRVREEIEFKDKTEKAPSPKSKIVKRTSAK